MKTLIILALLLLAVVPVLAATPANHAPAKAPAVVVPNLVDPNRQGGDTIADAVVIPSLPYTTTGTTTGYANDYDEICPLGSNSPDVVYSLEVAGDWQVTIDLCGSDYDTKVFVYDPAYNVVACNDDYYFDDICGRYTSKIEDVWITGLVYIVVDGYYGSWGDYILAVTGEQYAPCVLACPQDGAPEGEPPLHDDYVDHYNGGCDTWPDHPFQRVEPAGGGNGSATICGVSGWYLSHGEHYRDSDWFILSMGASGSIGVAADAEQTTQLCELAPQNCVHDQAVQAGTVGWCEPGQMTITGYPMAAEVWFRVAPASFTPPPGADSMYDYVVWFSGLNEAVATAPATWSQVKALYN